MIYVVGFLRSLGVGMLGVVLGVYLSRVGVDATNIGLVIGIGLLGACAATAVVAWSSRRIGYRASLVTLSLLAALGGVALALLPSFPLLLLLVFVGMVNGMGTDRSAAFALEQAIIPGLVPDRSRTWGLSWYNVWLDSGGALGALGAGVPLAVSTWAHIGLIAAYRYLFVVYALLHVATALLYFLLPADAGLLPATQSAIEVHTPSGQSRNTVHRIAALFAVDAFGGGFLTDALVSYWFFHRFGLTEEALGLLFFVVHVLNATSHLGAAWIAQRISAHSSVQLAAGLRCNRSAERWSQESWRSCELPASCEAFLRCAARRRQWPRCARPPAARRPSRTDRARPAERTVDGHE
jgi:MFS family permease